MKKIGFTLLLTAVFIIINSCGVTSVSYIVKRPAPIALKGQKKIAMGEFSGLIYPHNEAVAGTLASYLLDSGYFDAVYDRKMTQKILDQQLTNDQDSSNNTLSNLNFLPHDAVYIYGDLVEDRYREDMKKEEKIHRVEIENPDKKNTNQRTIFRNETNYVYTRNGVYSLMVNFQVVDIQTGKLIAVKRFSAERKDSRKSTDMQPEKISDDKLFFDCVYQVCSNFVKNMLPYKENVAVIYQTDEKMPELALALNYLKSGEFESARNILIQLTIRVYPTDAVTAKAFYNLGMALAYNGEYDEAVSDLKRALDLNPKENLYPVAIETVKKEKTNAEKLKEEEGN